MPQLFVAIGAGLAAAAASVSSAVGGLGTALAGGGLLPSIGGKLLGLTLSLGLTVLLGLIDQPQIPSAVDSQRTTREAVSYRRKIYGRRRVSGALLSQRLEPNTDFFDDIGFDGHLLYWLIAICDRRTAAINKFIVDGKVVDVDEDGYAEKLDSEGETIIPRGFLRFETRLGTQSQAVFAPLAARFDMIDSTWRGRGVTLLAAYALTSQKIYERLPNGKDTSFGVEGDFGFVWDPRDEAQDPDDELTWEADSNAALVILNHLTAPRTENGYAIPVEMIDLDSFRHAADVSDVVVNGPRGTTRRQWELHGIVDYGEAPSRALTGMLAACDGKLVPSAGGRIGLVVGGWTEPTVTLTGDDITSIRQTRGGYLGDEGTVIKSRYLSPEHGYIEQDAIEYVHPAAATRGRSTKSIDTMWAANHGQCRHVQKITAARINAPIKVTVDTGLKGLLLVGERFLTIRYRRIDHTFELTSDLQPLRDGQGYLVGFRFNAVAMTAADIAYDELVDGVDPPPVPPDDEEASLVPGAPTIDVTMRQEAGPSGTTAAVVAAVEISDSSSAYFHRVEYRETGSAGIWSGVDLDVGALAVDIGGLFDGRTYDFRARARSGSGDGEWSPVVTRTVVYDTTAPGDPVNVAATGGAGEVDISWRGPSSNNVVYVAVYRAVTNSFGAATLVDTVGTLRNATANLTDTGLVAGTYYYFLTAGNGSAIESDPPVATGAVVVS